MSETVKAVYNIFICLFFTAAVGGTFVSCAYYNAPTALALVFCVLFFLTGKLKLNIKTVITLSFLLRILAVFLFPAEPFSDYLKYHETALGLIHNDSIDSTYLSAFPHTLSYSFFVSVIYRIFGENPQAVYIINAVLGTLTVWLVYKCSNEKCAFLCGIFPASILYTGIMATETPYTLLYFTALYFAKNKKSVLSGICAAFMNLIRPTGIIFLIAYFIYTFFYAEASKNKNKILKFISFILAYICITAFGNVGLEKISGFELTESPFGYNIYVGMNSDSMGRWNIEDYDLAMSFSDASEMHEFMAKSAWARFINNGFIGNIKLFTEKFSLTWGGGSLVCYYLSRNTLFNKLLPLFVCLTQGFHLYIAIAAFIAVLRQKKADSELMLPILLVLGHTLMYLITETMERYVYTPFLTVILITGAVKGNYGMLFKNLMADIDAVLERDPASKSRLEVYFLSPGVKALKMHRWSNFFWRHGFEFIAKFISMRARKKTGIEIHPAAKIGKGVMIDHGMGVVIGETAVVGDNCTIYQNVTLGGTGKDTGKRHPTIGNNVMIGSGAKVLGPFTVGDNSKIAANAVVLSEVPPDCTCVGVPARVVKQNNKRVHDCSWQMDQTHIPDPVSQELCKIIMRLEQLENNERNEK